MSLGSVSRGLFEDVSAGRGTEGDCLQVCSCERRWWVRRIAWGARADGDHVVTGLGGTVSFGSGSGALSGTLVLCEATSGCSVLPLDGVFGGTLVAVIGVIFVPALIESEDETTSNLRQAAIPNFLSDILDPWVGWAPILRIQ